MAHTVLEPNGSILLLTAPLPPQGKKAEQRAGHVGARAFHTRCCSCGGAIPAVTTFKPKAKYRVGEEGLPVIQFP